MGEVTILILVALGVGFAVGCCVGVSRDPIAPSAQPTHELMRIVCVECGAKAQKLMAWTNEKPTQYGWYWLKEYHHDEEPLMVEVLGDTYRFRDQYKKVKEAPDKYEWQGPLHPQEPYYG